MGSKKLTLSENLPNSWTLFNPFIYCSIVTFISLVYQSTQGFGTKKQAEQNAAEVVLSQLDFSSLAASGDQSSATQTSSKHLTLAVEVEVEVEGVLLNFIPCM